MTTPIPQYPCSWCQGSAAALSCHCKRNCGGNECPYGEGVAFGPAQPVPRFPEAVRTTTETSAQTLPIRPEGVVVTAAPDAIERVLDLHSRCDCKACSNGQDRWTCRGCSDFWPCKTVHAVRGTTFKP